MIQDSSHSDSANGAATTTDTQETGPPETANPVSTSSTEESVADAPTDTPVIGEPVSDLPLDVTFEILKNSRRRTVLEYLREAEGTVTIGELAEHIAAIENDTTVHQLNAQQRKRVYIGLYQCHLPKMDDANVVEFNQSRGLVSSTEMAGPLYEYLDTSDVTPEPDTAHRTFALTIATGAGFVVAQFAGLYLVASLVVLAFLATVLYQTSRAFDVD